MLRQYKMPQEILDFLEKNGPCDMTGWISDCGELKIRPGK